MSVKVRVMAPERFERPALYSEFVFGPFCMKLQRGRCRGGSWEYQRVVFLSAPVTRADQTQKRVFSVHTIRQKFAAFFLF